MSYEQTLQIPDTNEKSVVSLILVDGPSRIFIATDQDNKDCTIWLFDLAASLRPVPLRGHTHVVSSLAVDDHDLFSGAHDKIVLWDLRTKEVIRTFEYPPATAHQLLIWDNDRIVSSHFDRTIRIWNRDTAICMHELTGHTYRYGIRHLLRHDDRLFSAAEDIRLWDIESGTCVGVFELEGTSITSICVNGDNVVAGCLDKMVRVWDIQSRKLVVTLTSHPSPISHVRASGIQIITATADGSLSKWSTTTFKLITRLPPPTTEGPRCGPWGCTGGIISMNVENGVVLANGWEGAARAGPVADLSKLQLLGLPRRGMWQSTLYNGRAYVALTEDGKICIEIWDLRILASGAAT